MSDLLSGLNPAQQEAVTYQGGPLLVLAGAGSGKTRVLTHRAAWLIQQGLVEPGRLLLLTFTNKAAGEMKTRLLDLLGLERSPPGLFAGTFHSFSAYALRRDGQAIGLDRSFVIYDENDQLALVKTIVKDLGMADSRVKPEAALKVIESAKNDLIDAGTFLESVSGPWQRSFGNIYFEYQKRLKKNWSG
ncbi:MAG: UvrD-helicase domain-containing protein [Patescibacteria group bacterium]